MIDNNYFGNICCSLCIYSTWMLKKVSQWYICVGNALRTKNEDSSRTQAARSVFSTAMNYLHQGLPKEGLLDFFAKKCKIHWRWYWESQGAKEQFLPPVIPSIFVWRPKGFTQQPACPPQPLRPEMHSPVEDLQARSGSFNHE